MAHHANSADPAPLRETFLLQGNLPRSELNESKICESSNVRCSTFDVLPAPTSSQAGDLFRERVKANLTIVTFIKSLVTHF